MALKYCPDCDEEYSVDDEEVVCPECGGTLEAADEGEDEDEEEWEEE